MMFLPAFQLAHQDLLSTTPLVPAAAPLQVIQVPNPDRMHRLLRVMAAVGLLAEHPGGRFSLTPMGAALRTDHPASAKWMTLVW
jgi:hypothetical protein